MIKTKYIHTLLLCLLLPGIAIALGSCASSRRVATTGQAITASPSPYEVKADTGVSVPVELTFQIPEHYFKRRARLIITPQVVEADRVVAELMPLVADAPIYSKKLHRRQVLEQYADTLTDNPLQIDRPHEAFSLAYADSFRLEQTLTDGHIRAVVSTDGCGECTGIDTLLVATLTFPQPEPIPAEPMQPAEKVAKLRSGEGELLIHFVIDHHDIDPDFANNRSQFDRLTTELIPLLRDSAATLTELTISALASADGPWAHNEALALRRAREMQRWLTEHLPAEALAQTAVTIESRPEGWMPVVENMRAASNPHTAEVEAIVRKYADQNDDLAEWHIRRLPYWREVRTYLPKDRKVSIHYKYILK